MGVSTDAYLYFGFDFHDNEGDVQCEWMDEYGDDWEEFYIDKLGLKDDSGFWTEEGNYAFEKGTPEYKAADKKRDKWHDKKMAVINKLTKDGTIGIYHHCHHDYPVWFVHVHYHSASRGYPMEINPSTNMKIDKKDIKLLKQFCEELEIEYQEPKWFLASYWG